MTDDTVRRCTVVAGAGVAVVLVVLQTSRYGARVSSDGVSYLAAARGFAAHGTLVQFDGEPLVHWPPLFPLLLSVRAPSLQEAAVTARWLNAVCFGATVALVGTWLYGLLSRRWLAMVGTALVACALPLWRVATAVVSEPLFVLLCLVTLRLVDAARQPEAGVGPAVLAGVCAGLAALTRYAGVLLVLFGALALLLPVRRLSRRRVAATLVFLVLGWGPVMVWLVHTAQSGEPPGGERARSEVSIGRLTETAGDTLVGWLLPATRPNPGRATAVVVAIAGVAWTAARVLRRRAGTAVAFLQPALLLALFAGTYVGGLIATSAITRLSPPGDRLLAPIAIPLMIVGLVVVDVALADPRRVVTGPITAGVCSLLLYQLALAVHLAAADGQARSAGFEGPRWTGSMLLARLDAVADGPDVYTNAAPAVLFRTGRLIQALPNPATAGVLSEDQLVDGSATVVWFSRQPDPVFTALGQRYHLDPVVVVADGGVYRVSPEHEPEASAP